MIYTFKDMRDFCAEHISTGVSPDSTKAKDTVNEAVEIIMNEGDFKYTRRLLKMRVMNKTIGCPEFVERILAIDFATNPGNVYSMGYEFMHSGPGLMTPGNDLLSQHLIDKGDGWATFYPIGPTKRVILAFSTEKADQSLTIRVRGKTQYHNEVNPGNDPGEQLVINRWKDGIEGRAVLGSYTPSTNEFLEIDSIVKPVTAGYVTLFSYDPTTYNMWYLSKYAPHETQPGYHRYRMTGTRYDREECITALVKMRFVPMEHDTDVCPIQNRFAIRMMCKSVHEFNFGEERKAAVFYSQALRSLDRELANSEPISNEYDFQMEDTFGNIPPIL